MKGLYIWIWSIALLAYGCGDDKGDRMLTIAAAANMQFAMEEMEAAFTEATGIPCELVISSSGKLTAQIREGAPFDVLISADMKYPEELYRMGLTATAPEIYGYGKLVLWTLQEYPELDIQTLQSDQVRHVALANPSTAPYGRAAVEVLEHYGLYEQVEDKLVFGESIAQTNQFILSRAAEIGFTALSVVRASELSGPGRWVELDSAAYQPIAQGVVVIGKSGEANDDAIAFRDFLFSEEGRKILTKFGYAPNE